MFKKIILVLLSTISSLSMVAGDQTIFGKYGNQAFKGQNDAFRDPDHRWPIDLSREHTLIEPTIVKTYIKDNSRVEPTVIDRYKSTLRVGLLCSFGTMVIGGLSFIGTPYDKSYFKTYCRDIFLPMATKVGLATAAINFLRCVGLPTQEQYVTSASDKIANLKINDASDLKEVTKKLCLISATLEHIDGRRIKMAGFDKLKTKSISLRDKYARDLMKVDARAVELAQARMDELD